MKTLMKYAYAAGAFLAVMALGAVSADAQGVLPTSMPVHETAPAVLGASVVAPAAQGVIPTSMPIASNGEVLGAVTYQFVRDLSIGANGSDVKELQAWLNSHGYPVAASGPGSLGEETTTYGELTAHAVSRLQEANMAAILAPLGLVKGTGQFGASTRAFVNALNR